MVGRVTTSVMPTARSTCLARSTLAATLLLVLVARAGAGPIDDLRDELDASLAASVRAAIAIIAEDPVATDDELAAASGAVTRALAATEQPEASDALGRRARGLRRRLMRLSLRTDRARTLAQDEARSDTQRMRAVRGTARAADGARRAVRLLPFVGPAPRGAGPARGGFYRPNSRPRLVVDLGDDGTGVPCAERPLLTVETLGADGFVPARAELTDLGGGRWGLSMGPDIGGARVRATACGVERSLWIVNTGPRRALTVSAPTGLDYGEGVALRSGREAPGAAPGLTGGAPDGFSVAPALPPGLTLDPASGALGGVPLAASPSAEFTVTAHNRRGSVAAPLRIAVGPPLPPEVEELAAGFTIEEVASGFAIATRVARAPDGRLFVSELMSGDVRVIDAAGNLLTLPFAHVDVLTGGERGLMGLALAPDFSTSGHVFVYASVASAGEHVARNQVVRFTANGNTGSDPTVILDDIPLGLLQNGGALAFGPDGKLYVTVGDTGDPGLSQDAGSLSGKVLRLEPDGAVPADNPFPDSLEWCRGLRNAYDLTLHPATGGLFGTENGPTFGDELNLIQSGKNYEWGAEPESVPGALVGPRLMEWTPVIVPTGAAFHDGTAFGAEFANNLFLCGYDDADVRRLLMSGPKFTDVDAEIPFLRFVNEGNHHKPLDVLIEPDGTLVVATFTRVWRIRRY